MSSTPTNPYKSRLLNLINRQSLRLKDQLTRTGRHLKIAVELGVQVLIYPLYLLVQTGRIAERQLKQKIQQQQALPSDSSSKSQPQPVTCNQPIEHILEVLEPWLSEGQKSIAPSTVSAALEKVSLSSLTHFPPSNNKNFVIQGLATLLENKQLVLVTSENLLLNIFSPTQQAQLEQRIYWELVNYQYQQRLQQRAAKKFLSLIPSFQINSPNVVPPVRWFWTVMRWIQTSELASAINLFGESTLIRRSPSFHQIAPSEQETRPIYPFLIEQNNNFISAREELDDPPANFKGKSEKLTADFSLPKTAEPDPFQIQFLIQAAIDYFFGKHQNQVFLRGNKATIPLSTPPELSQRQSETLAKTASLTQALSHIPEPDPWLSWDDLFSPNISPENTEIYTDSTVEQVAELPPAKTTVQPKNTFLKQIQQPITQQDNAKSLRKKRTQNQQINQLQTPTVQRKKSQVNSLDVPEQTSVTITPISSQSNQIKATPDWIETEATPVGYVKHPLVRVLEALDLIIFWFEKLWLRFWHWLKRLV